MKPVLHSFAGFAMQDLRFSTLQESQLPNKDFHEVGELDLAWSPMPKYHTQNNDDEFVLIDDIILKLIQDLPDAPEDIAMKRSAVSPGEEDRPLV